MNVDPIGPLVVAARDGRDRARVVQEALGTKLDQNGIARHHHADYQRLDAAIWTLDSRLQSYQAGALAGSIPEQANAIAEALRAVETTASVAQQAINQLP